MTDNKPNKNEYQDSTGRFKKGNPGRPRGVANKTPCSVLRQVEAMNEMALKQLWSAVCMQENWAVLYVLNKIVPASRTVAMEGLTTDDLKAALAEGDISPDESKTLAATLRTLAEIESLDEIRARLDSLEEAAKDK